MWFHAPCPGVLPFCWGHLAWHGTCLPDELEPVKQMCGKRFRQTRKQTPDILFVWPHLNSSSFLLVLTNKILKFPANYCPLVAKRPAYRQLDFIRSAAFSSHFIHVTFVTFSVSHSCVFQINW